LVCGLLVAMSVLAMRPRYEGARAGMADENYISSKTCISCHDDHYASWARTHHSRMTQDARPGSVQGDFERENSYDYLGVRARMTRSGGAFLMTLAMPDGSTRQYKIDRTVGSRRIEQYLARQGDRYVRLPLAYDLVNRRWMSLNGSFFRPDSENYFQHLAEWDSNCVFCHNVKAQPKFDFASRAFKSETEVAELGIACGACHGAAASHAQAALSPFTRTLWRMSGSRPTQIVNPSKLDSDRAMMVCGHCHGQRVPEPLDRIEEILSRGDPFNAGEDLFRYYKPVTSETTLRSVRNNQPFEMSFANRFWANGSPRLTAYELQGVLRSKCFTGGEPGNRISCITCHTMHGGDPKGQITEENRTNRPCLACHKEFEPPDRLEAHTKHKADSVGSNCYTCHMPRVVFGVMSIHPTHDITVPDPRLTATQSVPNACNQCHLDKSVNWAINESKRLWPRWYAALQPVEDPAYDIAEGPRSLFSGDALARALAAEAMGGGGPMKIDPQWAGPYLTEALADNYPIVRFFAANGLARGPWLIAKPDYLAPPAARQQMLYQWRAAFSHQARENAVKLGEWLRSRRLDVDIEVGE
jgi:predicted CXXCH cytochrome family protein